MPNAFATGRGQKSSVVAVTTGLLDILDTEELEGVVAHELTHIRNRDALVSDTCKPVLNCSMVSYAIRFLRSACMVVVADMRAGTEIAGVLC